jgi:hypothetical protein
VINGLACFTFFLFYLLYKYLFLCQHTQTPSADMGGLFFPKAIQHVFVGMYIQQLCLCALFFLVTDPNGKLGALPEGVLMIVLIVLTAGHLAIIDSSSGPLTKALSLSHAHKTFRHPAPSLDPRDVDGGSGSNRKEAAEEEIEEGPRQLTSLVPHFLSQAPSMFRIVTMTMHSLRAGQTVQRIMGLHNQQRAAHSASYGFPTIRSVWAVRRSRRIRKWALRRPPRMQRWMSRERWT